LDTLLDGLLVGEASSSGGDIEDILMEDSLHGEEVVFGSDSEDTMLIIDRIKVQKKNVPGRVAKDHFHGRLKYKYRWYKLKNSEIRSDNTVMLYFEGDSGPENQDFLNTGKFAVDLKSGHLV
jgi:hypothetical protein